MLPATVIGARRSPTPELVWCGLVVEVRGASTAIKTPPTRQVSKFTPVLFCLALHCLVVNKIAQTPITFLPTCNPPSFSFLPISIPRAAWPATTGYRPAIYGSHVGRVSTAPLPKTCSPGQRAPTVGFSWLREGTELRWATADTLLQTQALKVEPPAPCILQSIFFQKRRHRSCRDIRLVPQQPALPHHCSFASPHASYSRAPPECF
jgi:hypothetical protein